MKKRIFFPIMIMIFIVIIFNQCTSNWLKTVSGNGNVTKELREIGSFDVVKSSAGIQVFLFQGDEEKVIVETDENIQDCLTTDLNGSVLQCRLNCRVSHPAKLNVYVYCRDIEVIKASSGSSVYGETPIETDHLNVKVSSGAKVNLEVYAHTLNCKVSSGSNAVLKGKADRFDGSASSSAGIRAGDLMVKICKASASSSGNIMIAVSETIDAKASSSGDVVYSGNPEIEYINESSSGCVRKR